MRPEATRDRPVSRRASLAIWFGVGLVARLAAAAAVQRTVDRQGTLCVFPDTAIYWSLGRAIARGEPYVVWQWGVPHFALRTPGYPIFLSAIQAVFGSGRGAAIAARVVQAALGASCVWLVHGLVARVFRDRPDRGFVALSAAVWTAVDPYTAGLSVLLLSESAFVPLMLLGLWIAAAVWDEPSARRRGAMSLAGGIVAGAAVLTRPSWLPFVASAEAARWVFGRGRAWEKARESAALLVGFCAVMAPWWIRTERTTGRFALTAVWVGASLYDGLNPSATGESDMRFLERPEFRALDEVRQDQALRREALEFARTHPLETVKLAARKFGRFWSPWPNAASLRSPAVAIGSSLVSLPIFGLIALGLRETRRDARAWILLAGPAASFAILHLIFVGSARYRIPGMIPAFGLAAAGLSRIVSKNRS